MSFCNKTIIDLLCICDWLPVDDSSLDEDSDVDLYGADGVCGDTKGHGGIVVHNIQRTQVHGTFVAAVDNPGIVQLSSFY